MTTASEDVQTASADERTSPCGASGSLNSTPDFGRIFAVLLAWTNRSSGACCQFITMTAASGKQPHQVDLLENWDREKMEDSFRAVPRSWFVSDFRRNPHATLPRNGNEFFRNQMRLVYPKVRSLRCGIRL